MAKTTIPDSFRSPATDGEMLSWSPYLRLAHDFRIPQSAQRLYFKERLGDHALHYFFTGSGEYRIADKMYTIIDKSVFLRRPGENYDFRLNEGVEVRMLNIHFDLNEIKVSHCPYPCPDDDADLKNALPSDLPGYQQLNNYPAYEQTFFQLLEAAGYQGTVAHLHQKSLLMEIISLLYANLSSGRKSATMESHQHAIDKVMRHIHAHPDIHPTLEELAEIAGVSRALFCRIFRQTTGLTPQKFLNRHRVELATAELLYSDTPVKNIASRCGFADVHHFSRIFKSITGTAPASFRARHNLYE